MQTPEFTELSQSPGKKVFKTLLLCKYFYQQCSSITNLVRKNYVTKRKTLKNVSSRYHHGIYYIYGFESIVYTDLEILTFKLRGHLEIELLLNCSTNTI